MYTMKTICENFTLFLVLLTVKIQTFAMPHQEYQDRFAKCLTTDNFRMFFEHINATQFKESQRNFENTTKEHYLCDLGDDSSCDSWWVTANWKITNSIGNGMTNILNDERWEALQVQQLEDKFPNGTLKYTKLLSLYKETVVPISWSISNKAQLYFCSEGNVIYSFCIKMTFSEGIKVQKAGIVGGKPESLLNETNWADGRWRSFLWSFKKGRIVLKEYHHSGQEIDYPYPGISLGHLFGRSQGPMDFVKIQNYNFLRTEKAGFHQIGRPFFMSKGLARISLYVAMCKTCKMIFMMAGIEVAVVEFAEEGAWRHVVINLISSSSSYQQLYVFLIGNSYANKENNYWAMDYVKMPSSGTRTIKIQGNYSCGFLHPEVSIDSKIFSASLEMDPNTFSTLKFFKIISFNNNTLSFVFKNYPGEKFSIVSRCMKYQFGNPEDSLHNMKPEKCRIWRDLYCASIKLPAGSNSSFTMNMVDCYIRFYQTNGIPVGSARFYLKDTYNKYEIAQAPGDLEFLRDRKSNAVLIRWTHPYVHGENLKSFEIKFTRASPKQKSLKAFSVNFKIGNPKNTYRLVISNFTYESCDEYFLQVRPINKLGHGFAATNLILTPPLIPSINIKKEKRNETIHFSIEPVHSKCRGKIENFSHRIFILHSGNQDNNNISKEIRTLEKILNKNFSETFRRNIKIITIKGSEKNIDFDFSPDDHKNSGLIMFLELINYEHYTKYYEHEFDLNETNERLLEQIIHISLAAFLVGILVPLLIWCCCMIVRRFRKKKESLNMVRPRTVENIYFSVTGDRIKLIDESLWKSTNQTERRLGSKNELRRGSSEGILESQDLKPVKTADLERYVKISITNNDLSRQFESLPVDFTKPCENGQLEYNKPKNRFKNILPYDDSRVKLAVLKKKEGSDYINANYIKGYKRSKSFIAAQGPKSLTINDFWRMVWQENVRNIIMLVNLEESGVKKVEKYWPSHNEDFQFGKIHVFYHSSETFADYEIRVFRLVCDGSERKVLQYHYQNWPDNGVPIVFQSLVGFIRKTMEIHSKTSILVHCCSGTSATGVYILCHICLQMAREIGAVDVFKIAKQLRDQRVNMIHDVLQYKLAHLLILEYLVGLQAVIACHEDIEALVAKLTDPEKLRLQMMYLEDLSWQYRALAEFPEYEHIFTVCPKKNKVPDIVPDVIGAIQLARYPDMDESSSYINAIKVDGYQCSQRYIVTQQPMPNTLNDFWRMVIQQDVEVIVSLNDINLKDKKSCIIWPTEDNPKISPVDFIIIKHFSTVAREIYDVIVVHVLIQGKKNKTKPVKVTIVAFKGWKPKKIMPGDMQNFLKFCGFVDSITRQLEHTVVTCYDGCLASGVYVATSYLIEMIKNQKCFDVCNTVRVIRRNRKQFITEEMQLAFLYEVSATYIEGYQDYANFATGNQRCYNVYDYIE